MRSRSSIPFDQLEAELLKRQVQSDFDSEKLRQLRSRVNALLDCMKSSYPVDIADTWMVEKFITSTNHVKQQPSMDNAVRHQPSSSLLLFVDPKLLYREFLDEFSIKKGETELRSQEQIDDTFDNIYADTTTRAAPISHGLVNDSKKHMDEYYLQVSHHRNNKEQAKNYNIHGKETTYWTSANKVLDASSNTLPFHDNRTDDVERKHFGIMTVQGRHIPDQQRGVKIHFVEPNATTSTRINANYYPHVEERGGFTKTTSTSTNDTVVKNDSNPSYISASKVRRFFADMLKTISKLSTTTTMSDPKEMPRRSIQTTMNLFTHFNPETSIHIKIGHFRSVLSAINKSLKLNTIEKDICSVGAVCDLLPFFLGTPGSSIDIASLDEYLNDVDTYNAVRPGALQLGRLLDISAVQTSKSSSGVDLVMDFVENVNNNLTTSRPMTNEVVLLFHKWLASRQLHHLESDFIRDFVREITDPLGNVVAERFIALCFPETKDNRDYQFLQQKLCGFFSSNQRSDMDRVIDACKDADEKGRGILPWATFAKVLDLTPLILTFPETRQLCHLLSKDSTQPECVNYLEIGQFVVAGIVPKNVSSCSVINATSYITTANASRSSIVEKSYRDVEIKRPSERKQKRPLLLGCSSFTNC